MTALPVSNYTPIWPRASRGVIWALCIAAATGGAFMCMRRLTGGLTKPLDVSMLVAASAAMIIGEETIRRAAIAHSFAATRGGVRGLLGTLLFVLIVVPLSITFGSVGFSMSVMIWFIVAFELALLIRTGWNVPTPRGLVTRILLKKVRRFRWLKISRAQIAFRTERNGVEATEDEMVTQRLRRAFVADGSEVITALLTATVPAGERSRIFHLAFCPPFPLVPEAAVSQIEGPNASANIAELRSYGARIEARLSKAHPHSVNITVEFSGRTSRPAKSIGPAGR